MILFWLGGSILLIYSVILTFAPVVRLQVGNTPLKWEHWIAILVWGLLSVAIHKFSVKYLPNRDPIILPVVFLLTGIGILSIFRLSVNFGWRQLIWFAICVFIFLLSIRYRNFLNPLRKYKYIWLILGLVVTILTFFFGIYPGGVGPRLWLGCCGVYFQPSEPLKLLFIAYLAAFFADNWAMRKNLSTLIIPSLIMVGVSVLVLIAQRDLGTATIILTIYAFFILLVSGKRKTIFIFLLLLIIAGFLGYRFYDVIQIRIDGWLNPWLDPSGGSYQIIQSLQAIAAGHFLGSGPGLGSPGIIPVVISDFIFSAITEELGLLGGIFIISLYALLAYRGISIAIKARNQYQRLLATGITVFVALQTILIIGGNTRFLPLTGVTLPFISYGGSSLLTMFIATILLLEISQNQTSKTITQVEVKPYVFSYSLFSVCFVCLSLLTSYWAILRSESLLDRQDNFRRVVNDLYVPRGDLLDRQNKPILTTIGQRGSYSRQLIELSLSTTVGYNDPYLGQSGLEASMDSYLRGLAGLPASEIWWNEMLYARPPDGLDIRTTIDLTRQNQLVETLSGYSGAAVIMNANTGEILGIWSSPSFNPADLENNVTELLSNEDASLINRVSQGKYELGNLWSIFILGDLLNKNVEIEDSQFSDFSNCAISLSNEIKIDMGNSIKNGCDESYQYLSTLNGQDNFQVLQQFNFDESYTFELPIDPVVIPDLPTDQTLPQTLVSPLQVVRSAAAFSMSGIIPYPKLTSAVNTPEQGWVVFSKVEPIQSLSVIASNQVADLLSRMDFPAWEISSTNYSEENPNHWYLTGTSPDWQGTPIVLGIVLENGSTEETKLLGRSLMEQILTSASN